MKTAIIFAALAVAAAGQTFPVAGTVVDAEARTPVSRMRVVLSIPHNEQTMVTGADGRFSFQAPAGRFSLFVERQGWRQVYGEEPGNSFGSSARSVKRKISHTFLGATFTRNFSPAKPPSNSSASGITTARNGRAILNTSP